MENKKYAIELEVVTPLSVGAGNDNDWMRGMYRNTFFSLQSLRPMLSRHSSVPSFTESQSLQAAPSKARSVRLSFTICERKKTEQTKLYLAT